MVLVLTLLDSAIKSLFIFDTREALLQNLGDSFLNKDEFCPLFFCNTIFVLLPHLFLFLSHLGVL